MLSKKLSNILLHIGVVIVGVLFATVTLHLESKWLALLICGVSGGIFIAFRPQYLLHIFFVSFFLGGALYRHVLMAISANDFVVAAMGIGAIGGLITRRGSLKMKSQDQLETLNRLFYALACMGVFSVLISFGRIPAYLYSTVFVFVIRLLVIPIAFTALRHMSFTEAGVKSILTVFLIGAFTQLPVAYIQSLSRIYGASNIVGTGMDSHGFLGIMTMVASYVGLYLIFSTQKTWYRVSYVVLTLGVLYAHFLSESRGALLGVLASLALFLTLKIRISLKQVATFVAIIFLCAIFYLFTPMGTAISRSFEGGGYGNTGVDISSASRIVIWMETINAFNRAPLAQKVFGHGLGAFVSIEFETVLWGGDKAATGAHNMYLHALAETGIVGLLIYLAILVLTLRFFWKKRESLYHHILFYLTVGLLVSGLVQETFWVQMIFSNFWLMHIVLMVIGKPLEKPSEGTL